MDAQMREYLDCHDLIAPRQFGFRKGTSTDQILLQLVNKIRHKLSKPDSRFVTLAALDIKKAFDCVNHELLTIKLSSNFHFENGACSFIKDYLSNRVQAMKVNGHISDCCMIRTGVPQGSVLGPLLFIMFINDLMRLQNCYLFADDCLLVTGGDSPLKSTREMETTMVQASEWYNSNIV